ncbi:hypothetical protein, partial [Treponema paraluiscuniculi]|uniref:hypothetical protein n=1 Tax=Treponema paraluiscuniculi TaxID=53435 RepID=UPI002FDBA4B6
EDAVTNRVGAGKQQKQKGHQRAERTEAPPDRVNLHIPIVARPPFLEKACERSLQVCAQERVT